MGNDQAGTDMQPAGRLARAAEATGKAGLSALLLTPGPDLRYVTGYNAHPTERITCLALPAGDASPFLLVPRLELRAAGSAPAARRGLEIVTWDETDDPYALIASRLRAGGVPGAGPIGLSDQMWAMMVLRLQQALPGAGFELASLAMRDLRARKTPAEVAELRAAGQAIDRVHARVPGFLRAGRTELEVAADIADAIVAEGHARVDFTIVGSGPNAASPHHEATSRVLRPGDAVVVDIGGSMASGYYSDCTRTYVIGTPPPELAAYYAVLKDAQQAACAAVRPGVSAEAVDAAAREPITAAGYGEFFLHRTGHGIGLELHEHPYITQGNAELLRPGHAFSVEPGIYPGPHGARIEDIVVCTEDGHERLNNASRELVAAG
ncbi:MAG TPA: Xaa-Pro peptidase family protein [Streptosporangiaceae bacterium]|jgi:Xaa-Pro aminopeptidase